MNNHRGFTLLEVLIALLIFAMGILGLIGSQATAQSMAMDAKFRTEAAMHADRLITQMWTDDRSNANLSAQYATGGAKYNAWAQQVQADGVGLPGSTGTNRPLVVVNADNSVVITLHWQGPQEKAAHTFLTTALIL